MSDLPTLPLERALAETWPIAGWRDLSVVIAVSGGADSVAMARALAKLKSQAGGPGRLILAHFNHRLRAEAENDAEFVRILAEKLELAFELGSADVAALASLGGDGIESAAREARYSFLLQSAQKHGARYIATAHTADDKIETTLFNILRGTGLAGLAGIPRVRPLSAAVTAIRPMLELRRADVLAYLEALGQDYRTDPTNQSLDYTRNRLRHELLPALREQYHFDIDNSLLRLSNVAADAQRLIERQAGELLDRCLLPNDSTSSAVRLDLRPLQNQDRHLVRELFITLWRRNGWPLQAMGFDEWNTLATMAEAQVISSSKIPCRVTLPGGLVVQRDTDKEISIILPQALRSLQ
jgi:tRNA(Ile)-lysidine synthase